jgi:hypothetical protein
MGWLFLCFSIGAVWWLLSRLRRPYVGLGLALLGAILACGLALAAGVAYLVFGFTPQQRGDDFSGLGVAILCVVGIPAAGALGGFGLGLGFAFRRERRFPAMSSAKPEPLDL